MEDDVEASRNGHQEAGHLAADEERETPKRSPNANEGGGRAPRRPTTWILESHPGLTGAL